MVQYYDNKTDREEIIMSEEAKRRKDLTICYMVLGVALVLVFIGLNTFLRQNRSEEYCDYFSFLFVALSAAFFTGLFYWLITYDPISPIRETTRGCAVGTAVSAMLMLFAVLLEMGLDEGFSLYGGKEIQLWVFSIEKKYFYDLYAIVWYPYNLGVILSALRKERFREDSVFYSCIAVAGSTLSGILIFRPMSNIYSVDLVVLNTITLAVGLWKYAIPEKTVCKGNVVAAVVFYAVMRIVLLPLQCSNWGAGVSADRNKPILQMLSYFGRSSVIVMFLLLAAFVFVIVKLTGIKNGREHRRWLIFATAAAMLTIRAVMGFLYSFGVQYPIKLPFMGNEGSMMDGMAFTLLLFCAWENRKIQEFHRMKDMLVSEEEILGKREFYTVLDEWKTLYEEDSDDMEDIFTSDEEDYHSFFDEDEK